MKAWICFAGLSFITALLVWWSKDFIFFWDTVQFAGKHGLWYYEQGLFGLLPTDLDSGHPPLFGIYQALLWTIFGKQLAVSSLSMLPFLLLNIYFAILIGKTVLGEKFWLFPVAMVSSPFYLGHSILVSPDLILISGFLMAFHGILAHKRRYIYLGTVLLCLISLRGIAITAALFIYQIIKLYNQGEKRSLSFRKSLQLFAPAFFLFVLYQCYHWYKTTWIGFHDDSPWSPSFAIINLKSLFRNCIVFGWRLVDYGMLIAYLLLAYFVLIKKKKHPLLSLLIPLLFIFATLTLPFSGLLNHRYFIPIQFVVLLIVLDYLRSYKLIYSLIVVSILAMGNLIIYPDKIAQGWDTTAAHWPFYKLEGTAFPIRSPRKFLDLTSNDPGYHEHNLSTDKYILYSNIMNEFSDEELDALKEWTVVKEYSGRGIKVVLYENKE